MKTRKKRHYKYELICNVFFFSCFHNYVSKNAFARRAIFSLIFWSHIQFNQFGTWQIGLQLVMSNFMSMSCS